jgi:cytochrome c-type biogenesis protein CcmH
MIGFALLATALVALALLFVLRPLMRQTVPAVRADRAVSNLQIIRDQMVELDLDLQTGAISVQQHAQAKTELERRVLEEAMDEPAPPRPPVRGGAGVVAAIAFCLPVAAALLYLHLGEPAGLDVAQHQTAEAPGITLDQFEEMTQRLAARLEENPDDIEGWSMLGRAYKALERYEDSRQAWARALQLEPDNPSVLTDYAEALALAQGGSLTGEPAALLERALRMDPDQPKALALAGGAAFEREDFDVAIRLWQRLLAQSGDDPELSRALETGIAEATARRAGKAAPAAVSGTVTLDRALAGRVSPEDTVFVFARAAQGPRVPLATVRVKVRDLPYRFSFDDSMAMTPEMRLSAFDEVVVVARVSKSGDAQPASGDIEGSSVVVKPGTGSVDVVMDRALP